MNKKKSEEIAIFRFGLIGDFVNQKKMPFGMQEKLLKLKSNCNWEIPYSKKTNISRGTILHWIWLYKVGGKKIEALYPRERNDIKKSRVLDKETANIITSVAIGSGANSVPELIKEIKNRNLIIASSIPKVSTIYRFLHNNNLMTYLQARKKCNIKPNENIEKLELWMQEVVQGKKHLTKLQSDLKGKMICEDIEILYDCIINRPLRYRKRAAGVLSISKGIPLQIIENSLNIPHTTLYYNFKTFSEKGTANIIADIKECRHVYEDPKYIDKFFSVLHAPPSAYGLNRTTWRQKDIRKVMEDCNMPISSHTLKKIIDNSGYKYRKAKTTLTSNDPEYKEKIRGIQNILSNLDENEKFFSIDEYGPFAIKMQGGRSLVPAGTTKKVPQWQKSKGSLIITAALELSTNQITHFYSEHKNTVEMVRLLDILIQKYSEQECIYFSWDAASWHASKALQKRVEEINTVEFRETTNSPFVKLAPLPTCAQFLNVIESVLLPPAKNRPTQRGITDPPNR